VRHAAGRSHSSSSMCRSLAITALVGALWLTRHAASGWLVQLQLQCGAD
jgi:hypothetical protein